MPPQKPKWQFVQHSDGAQPTWTWTRFLLGGEVDVHSPSFPDYGKAVYDALKNGFDPSRQHWSVTNSSGTVHYNRELTEEGVVQPLPSPATRVVRAVRRDGTSEE